MPFFCRASFLLVCFLQVHGHVFLDGDEATQVLRRRTRANGLLEELRAGNMERECWEEVCDWEEANEIFQDHERTVLTSGIDTKMQKQLQSEAHTWTRVKPSGPRGSVDGDACESTPCTNGGACKDGIGAYICHCPDGYIGFNCEINTALCEYENGGCQHFCNTEETPTCSCADGYFLSSDNKTCESNEVFKCGAIMVTQNNLRSNQRNMMDNYTMDISTDTNNTEAHGVGATSSTPVQNGSISQTQEQERTLFPKARMKRMMTSDECPPGECPWQALLINEDDMIICGGTILNQYVILTAAHCLNQSRHLSVVVGELDRLVNDGNEAIHTVEAAIVHQHYKEHLYFNNIALLKLAMPIQFSRYILPACLPTQNFAEKVLMKHGYGLVSGFSGLCEYKQTSPILQRLTMPYMDRITCLVSNNVRISPRMFCAGYDEIVGEQCYSDNGGPHVTQYHNTYFVTGIASYPKAKYGIYTQVSKYLLWIRSAMEVVMPKNRSTRHAPHQGPFKTLYL